MNHCPNCGEYIEEGNFCTNCGTELPEETSDTSAVDQSKTASDHASTQHIPAESAPQHVQVDEKKDGKLDIANYYARLVKKPAQAIETTANDLIPGLITLIVFALLVGSESYYMMSELSGGYISPSFTDDFLVSTLRFGLVLVAVVAFIFWGLKFTAKELPFQEVFAKYTAYLIPFVLIFALGFILEVINLPSVPSALMGVGSIGPLFVIPTLLILNSKKKEIDLVYLLIGIFAASYIVRVLLLEALMSIF